MTTGVTSHQRDPTTGINGLEMRQMWVPGVRLAEVRYRPNQSLPWHTHATSSITYLLQGSFTETLPKRNFDCRRGGLLVQAGGERHQNRYGPQGARCLVIVMSPDDRRDVLPRGVGAEWFEGRGVLPQTVSRLLAELRIDDRDSPLVVEGLVLEILGLISRERSSPRSAKGPPWLCRVRQRLHDDLRARLSLKDLAAEAGVSPDHLSRTFRATYGSLIGDYRREIRLNWVAERLASTKPSLVEIALAAGFADQSHMTRHFTHRFGISPGVYRRLRGGS